MKTKRLTIEEYNGRIGLVERVIVKGNFFTQEEVERMFGQKWYRG